MFQMNAGKFQFAVSKETTKSIDVNVPTPIREIYVYKMKENYGMRVKFLVYNLEVLISQLILGDQTPNLKVSHQLYKCVTYITENS